jgi:hypothetical protein
MTYKKVISMICVLLFLSITFFVTFPSSAYTAPPPITISVTPEKIYIGSPHCSASFIVTVTSSYKDKPTQLMFDELSEGDWTGPGSLISGAHFDGKEGKMPVGSDYKTVVTILVVSPWEKPAGEYKVRVYAFPEGTNPFEYEVYDIVTVVIANTGVEECDPDYWPPPPTDGTKDTTTDTGTKDTTTDTGTKDTTTDTGTKDTTTGTTDGWPPPPSDGTDGWDWWHWWRIDWGTWWPWTTREAFDFLLEVSPSLYSQEPGQSVSFTAGVRHVSGVSQTVSLASSGLPAGTTSSFSVPSANPSFTSTLTVSSDSSLLPGSYPITITGNGGGKTHSVTVSLIVAEGKEKTFLSVSATPPAVKTDETVSVGGALSPPIAVPIELVYTRPDGFEMIKHVTTSASGAFSDTFIPDLSGSWSVKARWSGDDDYFGCESQPVSLSVEAVPEKTSLWEKILGAASIIIIIIIIFVIAYLIFRRIRRPKGRKPIQTGSQLKQCIHCGATIPEESDYCPKCGKKI